MLITQVLGVLKPTLNLNVCEDILICLALLLNSNFGERKPLVVIVAILSNI